MGALLRSARINAGLTQRMVAARAGVSQPVVAAYESGRRQPTVSMLRRLLAAALHDLVITAAPHRAGATEQALMMSRREKLAAQPRCYDPSGPEDYPSHLSALQDVDRLRKRRGFPPFPRDDDLGALRARARNLGLLDARA